MNNACVSIVLIEKFKFPMMSQQPYKPARYRHLAALSRTKLVSKRTVVEDFTVKIKIAQMLKNIGLRQ